MEEFANKDGIIQYDDSLVAKEQAYNRILNWCIDHKLYDGDALMQDDLFWEYMPEIIADIVDEIMVLTFRDHDLKDCPFCGSVPDIEENYDDSHGMVYKIWCSTCGVGTEWWDDKEKAIEVWSKRKNG